VAKPQHKILSPLLIKTCLDNGWLLKVIVQEFHQEIGAMGERNINTTPIM
jgi:hypothetical protein